MNECPYCKKDVAGIFQAYPAPAKPCCGKASCLGAAKAASAAR